MDGRETDRPVGFIWTSNASHLSCPEPPLELLADEARVFLVVDEEIVLENFSITWFKGDCLLVGEEPRMTEDTTTVDAVTVLLFHECCVEPVDVKQDTQIFCDSFFFAIFKAIFDVEISGHEKKENNNQDRLGQSFSDKINEI